MTHQARIISPIGPNSDVLEIHQAILRLQRINPVLVYRDLHDLVKAGQAISTLIEDTVEAVG